MTFPESIPDEIMKRQCVFFIGAGMSIEAGLPSGKDLAISLLHELDGYDCEVPEKIALPEIAEEYARRKSRNLLEEKIRNEIVKKLDPDSTSFDLFARLEPIPEIVITTNYDRLIEKALGESNYIPIFEDEALGKFSPGLTNLYKIHGDIDFLSKSIITESDFQNFKTTHIGLYNQILSIFQSRPVIFIGFRLQDKNILTIYEKCCKDLDRMPNAYIVDPDELPHLKEINPNLIHIKMEAKTFFESLTEELSKKYFKTFPLDSPNINDPNYSNFNPFSIYSTEYFPEVNKDELVNKAFIHPINFNSIVELGNTIVEGHRGSGKSMILKYLSFDVQIKRNFEEGWDKHQIGIYLKFKPSLTNTTTQEFFRGSSRDWIMYFMTYVNLLIGEEIFRTMRSAINKNVITIDEEAFAKEIFLLFFDSSGLILNNSTIEELILLTKVRRNKLSENHKSESDLPPDFVEQLIETIKKYVPGWQGKNFFILLDEYDNLDTDQQKVVNTLIKNRSFSYKIGVKLFEMTYEDITGKSLEKNNDYTYVNTDRYDLIGESTPLHKYQKFVKDIANKRLELYFYQNTIEELLPAQKDKAKKGFENGDYSGFENVVKLSSGIIRDFLELCKDMIYYSNPWVVDKKLKDKLDPVIPNLQNTIIKIHSNIHYDLIQSIKGIDSESKRSRSENARVVIDSFAIIFQRIVEGSRQQKEKRTVTGFQLKNTGVLNLTSSTALQDASSNRLLQVPLDPRAPQNPSRYVISERYRFHRILCPRFQLSLSERWPKEIDCNIINALFIEPQKTIDDITSYFKKDLPISYTKNLDDFGENNV